jgi:ATP-dependent DNA helicase DinG
MREAIADAGGIEVFAVGRLDARGKVLDVEIHCRGNDGAVPALLSRPKPGDIVIHNHPNGVMQASGADMHLATLYGEDGVGFVIVDNAVERALWVVEPLKKERKKIAASEIDEIFRVRLPEVLPGHEPRASQIAMAHTVAESLNEGRIAVLEAGTGTGKSLAYLVPAALWAVANESKVAIATYTIALQEQLVGTDLPILERLGIPAVSALLKGRSHYLCRRQLAEAVEDPAMRESHGALLSALASFAETAQEGSQQDFGHTIPDELWEAIGSDHDKTLRARCPHFDRCFYYGARRRAATAHVLVVNHHLVLADLALKGMTGGDGVLPRFDRLVLDEGHHLEDAATSLFKEQVTSDAISRALAPLVPRKKRPGALPRLQQKWAKHHATGPSWSERIDRAIPLVEDVIRSTPDTMEELAVQALVHEPTRRITGDLRLTPMWTGGIEPLLRTQIDKLQRVCNALQAIEGPLAQLEDEEKAALVQPLFDLQRAIRRLDEHARVLDRAMGSGEDEVRWIEAATYRGVPRARVCVGPIDVGPLLRERVLDALETVVLTSATLTVGGSFDHFKRQMALEPDFALVTAVYESPFDYREQAVLALPRDVPHVDDPDFEDECARAIVDLLRTSGGGAFVLSTSHRLLKSLHDKVAREVGDELLLLVQGTAPRTVLLDRFRASGRAVLFGADSFWEGVSVAGESLRLVVIPRLPFRVPTHPVEEARTERLERMGMDPFRVDSLPRAALRLRQGAGRLIRTKTDHGAVVVLDRRIVDRWYGRTFLGSLPEMSRLTGSLAGMMPDVHPFVARRET